jgi:eukaryotic-like serine/threonine-protein kinase
LRAGQLVRSILATVAVAGIVVFSATTAAAAEAGWSQYQADPGHTGVAPSAPSAPFRTAWTTATGIGDETHFAGSPAPVIAGDAAVVVDREDVTAISLSTGAVAWTIPRTLGPSAPAAVVASGDRTTLLFTEGGGDLSSSAGGTPTPSPSAIPTPAERSTLVAVDTSTRRELWRRLLPDVSIGGPTVDGSTVLVGTDDGSVTAVALTTGDQEWTVDLGDSVNTPIAAAGGTAYAAVISDSREAPSLVALQEGDGTDVWRVPLGPPGSSIGAPAVAGGTVYATVGDGSVRALEATTGQASWAAKLNTVSAGGSPAVSSDAIVVSDVRGQVYRLAPATGDRVWDFAMNVPVYGAVVIAGSSVVVGDSSGAVSAIDLQTGERVWRQDLGEGLVLALAAAPETVLVARTGASAGLVGLVDDPNGVLTHEQSPTIVEPADLGLAWAVAAIPLVLVLVFAGRLLDTRLGQASFASGDDEPPDAFDEDLA